MKTEVKYFRQLDFDMKGRIEQMIDRTWQTIAADMEEAYKVSKTPLTLGIAVSMIVDGGDPCIMHGGDAGAQEAFYNLTTQQMYIVARKVLKPFGFVVPKGRPKKALVASDRKVVEAVKTVVTAAQREIDKEDFDSLGNWSDAKLEKFEGALSARPTEYNTSLLKLVRTEQTRRVIGV